jgi:hypothetical protein
MNSPALNFFIELWNRIRSKSPKFFMILQGVSLSLTFLGKVPTALESWFNVEVADSFVRMCNDISSHAIVFFAAASLPNSNPAVAKTENGTILKTTDEERMPFTAASEAKREENKKEDLPIIQSDTINKVN